MRLSLQGLDFLNGLIQRDPVQRMTAAEAVDHPWLKLHLNQETGTEQLNNILPCTSHTTSARNSKPVVATVAAVPRQASSMPRVGRSYPLAALQQRMVHTITSLTRQWSTQVYSLEQDRLDMLKPTLAPLAVLALVALFLVVNVALGLFGVLWYNISQRRAEIGLRRALGATGPAISRQFLGEVLILTTLGVLGGVLVAAQFPLLHAFDVATAVYVQAMLLAAGLVFVVTAVCAWQPSRLAASIQPAVALREE